MFKRILICTDLGDGINRLVNFIPQLAEAGVQQATFLHSVPLDDDGEIPREDQAAMQRAKALLAPATATPVPGIEVQVEVDSGGAKASILAMVQKYDAELVLLGSPIRSLLTQKMFGSTAGALAEQLKRPLMILRPPVVSTYMEAELRLRCKALFSSFLIPYDGSDSANHLLAELKQRIRDNPASSLQSCVLVWVIEPGSRFPQEDAEEKALGSLAQVQAELEALGLAVKTQVRRGSLMEQVMAAATEEDISAIAISDRKTNRFLDWSVPSFGAQVLRQSWHPVLFFPPA
ncbi:MAG: universal stress protein [Synechococcales cyanobacterium RM1_1_8]|nr:universal stress protein [Synechococcales cyanobacterium RM1_1_8]